jgi:hypothetical protein
MQRGLNFFIKKWMVTVVGYGLLRGAEEKYRAAGADVKWLAFPCRIRYDSGCGVSQMTTVNVALPNAIQPTEPWLITEQKVRFGR